MFTSAGLTVAITNAADEDRAQCGMAKQRRTTVMAKAAYMRSTGEYEDLEWELPSTEMGPMTYLARSADAEIEALIDAMKHYNEEAFLPRRSPPGDDVIFIMQDSAGLMKDDDREEVEPQPGRAGAAWFYSKEWKTIPWTREQWELGVLRYAHSTAQEAATGSANMLFAQAEWPGRSGYIEVYDSKSSTQIWHRGASRSKSMRYVVGERREHNQRHPENRDMAFWQERELGTIADMLSKYEDSEARDALRARFTDRELEAAPRRRPPNILNRLWRAAAVEATEILGVSCRPDWKAERERNPL